MSYSLEVDKKILSGYRGYRLHQEKEIKVATM